MSVIHIWAIYNHSPRSGGPVWGPWARFSTEKNTSKPFPVWKKLKNHNFWHPPQKRGFCTFFFHIFSMLKHPPKGPFPTATLERFISIPGGQTQMSGRSLGSCYRMPKPFSIGEFMILYFIKKIWGKITNLGCLHKTTKETTSEVMGSNEQFIQINQVIQFVTFLFPLSWRSRFTSERVTFSPSKKGHNRRIAR